MSLKIPDPLRKGDVVGFVSPSAGPSSLSLHRIEQAKKTLEMLGYRVKIAKYALQEKGYVSGTIEERVEDLHSMFIDSEVALIICTIGGNHSNQLLKYLDYNLIKNNPKIFIGYSDITVLHYALQSQANLATYYGPCAMTQFGEYPQILDYTLRYFQYELAQENLLNSYEIKSSEVWTEEFLDWFKKEDIIRPRKLEKNDGHRWLTEGIAEGPVLGGAILSINHLAGTKYWCSPEGTIFFIDILKEGRVLDEGVVDSLLADLNNLGLFDVIKGLIIGRPAGYSAEETARLEEMLMRYVKNKKCPILFNANIGHTDPIATIRYGRTVRLDSTKNSFMVL